MNDSWEITYPSGLVKFVDFFREKNFDYSNYDRIVKEYIDAYSLIPVKRICSLGCGTGRHEIQLTKLGYQVIGVERNLESFPIISALFKKEGIAPMEVVEASFLDKAQLDAVFSNCEFDAIVLLFIPLSIEDVKRVVSIFERYLKPGGIILTNQFFGYSDGFFPKCTLSGCDFANNPFKNSEADSEFCIRLNTFKYRDEIIDWTAVYIYYDDNGTLQMSRDHDIIEVLKKDSYEEILKLENCHNMELLPIREVTECSPEMNMPMTGDYIVAWRKRDA